VTTPPSALAAKRDASSGVMGDPAEQIVIAPRTLVTFVAFALGGVILTALVYATRGILVQLVVAVVLAMALEPLVQALQRRGLRRGRAAGVAFTLAFLVVAAFIYLLVPPLVDELTRFTHNVPGLLEKLTRGHGRLGFLERRFRVVEHARAAISATDAFGGAFFVLRRALSTVGAVITVAFLTLFVSLGGRAWFDAFLEVLPARSRPRWRRGGSGIATAVGGYVSGNLLISVVAGTVTTLLLLATHVPYPVPLGVLVAFFDLIPLVGATIGTILVAAVALTKGVPTTVIVVVGMVIYQQIENNALQPLVYNRTVKLSPLAIAVSVAAGAEIGGVAGALLGIPIAGALKVASREVIAWRRGEDAATPPPPSSHPGVT
jgi:predicted PurR-regulated permease PerM